MSKNPYSLTRANRANLLKLANYLDSLPRRYKHFAMEQFVTNMEDDDEILVKYALKNGGLYNNCKTSGCALGHGPAAGVLARLGTDVEVDDSYWSPGEKVYSMNWGAYGNRFVRDSSGSYASNQRLWAFLFSGDWDAVDNHHYGAAARIKFILDGNAVPAQFYDGDHEEMTGCKKFYKEYRK